MTRRTIIKQVKVYDANGQACAAYREVTPIEEYGRWAIIAFEVACTLVALAFVISLVGTTNNWF